MDVRDHAGKADFAASTAAFRCSRVAIGKSQIGCSVAGLMAWAVSAQDTRRPLMLKA
jgi:hypothetical protein